MKLGMLAILLALALPATAEPLDEMQAATIYALAHSVSHLPLPTVPPRIHIVSKAKLAALSGDPRTSGLHKQGDIYLDEALDMQDILNASILFHEYIHYMQWVKMGDVQTCLEWRDREIMAYHWQNEVLFKSGVDTIQAPRMEC